MISWCFVIASMPPSLYLGLLGLGAFTRRQGEPATRPTQRLAVVIPAHNESLMIAQTVSGVFAQDYPSHLFAVYVIADNCTDDTAEKARSQGARVFERTSRPGKGQGLHEAFSHLLKEDWHAMLVLDADSVIHPQCLAHLAHALENGQQALQLHYGVHNPAESWRTAAMELALASFNGLRPRARNVLGRSSGILGNGFCLSRDLLEKVPYLASSIVEDLEYHHHLLRAGFKVTFLDAVWVKAQMPAIAADARSQRERWERGRLALIRQWAPQLIRDTLRGKSHALEALIDVCMPPVSYLVLSLLPPLILGPYTARLAALFALVLLAIHYILAAVRYGSVRRLLQVALYLPWYLVWKLFVLLTSLIKHRDLAWNRTKRH